MKSKRGVPTIRLIVGRQPALHPDRHRGRTAERLLERMLAALPDAPERFQSLCGEVTDWEALMHHAGEHGVRGLLHHHLSATEIALPSEVTKQMERERAYERFAVSRLQKALDQSLAALMSAGVRAAALKGPVLAERLYPDPSLRMSVDLDLLVAPEEVDRAVAGLREIGLEREGGAAERFEREHHLQIPLHRPNSPAIELHFGVYVGFGIVVPAAPFLSRSVLYHTARGSSVWVLAPEDEFLHLALHAAGHRFECLVWLYDLKLLLRRHPDLDWSAVASRARELPALAALAFACDVLRRRLGAPIPNRPDLPPPRGLRQAIATALLATTGRHPVSSRLGLIGWIALQAVLCDRPAAAARMLQRRLVRFARRRAQRWLPGLVPEEWSA